MKKNIVNYEGVIYSYTLKTEGPDKGKRYIGSTTDEETRKKSWRNGGNDYAGKKIADARGTYGWKAFSYKVCEIVGCATKEELNEKLEEREAYWIQHYDSCNNGFNSSHGGTGRKGCKIPHDEIVQRNKTRKAKGFHHTQKTKDLLSKKLKGVKRNPDFCKKLSKALKGRKKTEEHKKKISEALKGRVISMAARAKSSATKKGKPHPISEQGRKNIEKSRYMQPVIAIDPKGNRTEFESGAAATRALNIKGGSITRCLKDPKAKTKTGYRFEYKDGIKKIPKKKQIKP